MKTCKECGREYDGRGNDYCSRECSNKRRRVLERESRKTYRVWSCGGGVQSVAIAALIYKGEIEKPDYAVMVDTGYEKSSVLKYVKKFLIPKLAEVGLVLNIVKTSDYHNQQLIDSNGYCIVPIFKTENGKTAKLRTCCNDKWKVQVIRKWLKERGVEQYQSIIGISREEAHRQRQAHTKYYTNTYPLVEMGMDRDACIRYITQTAGWPEPIRSSCYICGQQADGEWWRMRMLDREDFAKAVEVERGLRMADNTITLHRSGKTLEEAFRL